MPKYKGTFCIGACERFGHTCINASLYTQLAAEVDAAPHLRTEKSTTTDEEGELTEIDIQYYDLTIPPDHQPTIRDQLARVFPKDDPTQLVTSWGGEFPCHTACTTIICTCCGGQHDAQYTFLRSDGTPFCLYQPEEDTPEEVIEDDYYPGEDED